MHDFFVREILNTNIEEELAKIGFDKSYTAKASKKFEYKNFKIYNLTPAQANIIKQTALTVGADCATHRDVITGKIETSDCILGGSLSQIEKISEKLKFQPFKLKELGEQLKTKITTQKANKTQIMGILNLTTNSFSDGGQYYNFEDAIKQLNKLINDGADIIDIGAESTKPYSTPISADKQLEKIVPVLKYINDTEINVPISIDTRSAIVAQECIKYGAKIINDVSGFDYDKDMVKIIANSQVKVIIQHSLGTPENMQNSPQYEDLMDEIYINLKNKIDYALSEGIIKENIIIDPGIGFGKTREHNFEILDRWQELKTLGCPVLIGLSRKSLLNMPDKTNEEKDLYTLALNSRLIKDNIDIIRVHNVQIHKQFLKIIP